MPINLAALMATPYAQELLAVLQTGESLLALDMSLLGRSRPEVASPPPPSSVALLQLHGAIRPRGDGGMEGFARRIGSAAANPDVGAIVVDINSPGGTVAGTQEAANAVNAAKALKPVYAIADTMAASAAYWIGSQASQLWVTPSGEVGSIGVRGMHMSISRALADNGIDVTEITSGAYKGEMSPFAPLSEAAQAHVQAEADREHQNFINAVAQGRKVSRDKVASDFGQGRMVPADRAVSLGMADRVGTMSDLLGSLRTQSGTLRRRAAFFG